MNYDFYTSIKGKKGHNYDHNSLFITEDGA